MLLVIRIISLIILLACVVYSLILLKKEQLPPYFRCAFLSVTCSLLAYLYYCALSTDSSLDSVFTVGIFGEAAQFLFIITANIKYMEDDSLNKKFSLKGLLFALFLLVSQILYVVFSFSFEGIVVVIIYSLVVCPTGYFCVANMSNRNDVPFRKATFRFNLFTLGMLLCGGLSQCFLGLAVYLESEIVFNIGFCIPTLLGAIFASTSIFFLYRGLKQWKA